MLSLKTISLDPLFILGLCIRLFLITTVLPVAVSTWFAPFLDFSLATFNLDPWAAWSANGGASQAFPYGYMMWFAFLPMSIFCKIVGLPLVYGYNATLLAADIGLLVLLNELVCQRTRLLLAVYWLSPIVIMASYGLGFNDLIPVFLLVLSLYCVRQVKLFYAGLFCAAAISAKFSMIIALPFFIIYLIQNRSLSQRKWPFLNGLLMGTFVFGVPFLFSSAGVHMLFSNAEMMKVYQFAISLGEGTSIYVLPLFYLLMLYAGWRVRRMNFDLFQSILGISFLLVLLLTPAPPGWFVWVMPLFVAYQASGNVVAISLVGLFSMLYVLNNILVASLFSLPVSYAIAPSLGYFSSLVSTTMMAVGIVLAIQVWRDKIWFNDYFRLSRKPFVIGIAGDSGSGKDTFADALTDLFGCHSVASLSGDDYHLWDRHRPMWQVMTHLNPLANNLDNFANDLVSLTDGKSIISRRYNHSTGKMSRPFRVKSNDFIIASGLHALYLPILRSCYNLSIYLDIDENLRRHFKFQRDVHQRGHTMERVLLSLELREPDANRFIRPQCAQADLVFSLQPIHPHILVDFNTQKTHQPRFKLLVTFRNQLSEQALARVLIGVCGLHVDMVVYNESSEVVISIEGDISKDDIQLAAQMLCPRILEFLDLRPIWQDGMLGLMQLLTLSHINQALMKRFIC